jgi:AbrB family looped-hinge helix DNA binding protein
MEDRQSMRTRLRMDKAGRIVLPKTLRQELRLEPGDTLELERAGAQITLRPVRGTGTLCKEQGVWVLRLGQPLPSAAPDKLLQKIGKERDLKNLGGKGRS